MSEFINNEFFFLQFIDLINEGTQLADIFRFGIVNKCYYQRNMVSRYNWFVFIIVSVKEMQKIQRDNLN